MAASNVRGLIFFNASLSRCLRKDSAKGSPLFYLPLFLAFTSSILIIFYASSMPKLSNSIPPDPTTRLHENPFLELPKLNPNSIEHVSVLRPDDHDQPPRDSTADFRFQESAGVAEPEILPFSASPAVGGTAGDDLQRDQWRKETAKIDSTGKNALSHHFRPGL